MRADLGAANDVKPDHAVVHVGNKEREAAPPLAARHVIQLGWSLVVGLAGGWLILVPWAIGNQGTGAWSTATVDQVLTGAALSALGLLGTATVAVGMISPPRHDRAKLRMEPEPAAGVLGSDSELERSLITLAQALTQQISGEAGAGSKPSGVPAGDGREPALPTAPDWRGGS